MARIDSKLACGGRKKANLGLAIAGTGLNMIGNIVGGIFNRNAQYEAIKEYNDTQRALGQIQSANNTANIVNQNIASNQALNRNYDFDDNIIYRCGGRRKAAFGWSNLLNTLGGFAGLGATLQNANSTTAPRSIGTALQQELINNATDANIIRQGALQTFKCGGRKKAINGKRSKLTTPYITDGGVAIPIGRGLSLLRGATHEDINETGQTGIGIQVGRHQIEAQDGEVAQKKGRELRIFSDEPLLYGVSPADAVEAGYNPDIIFAAQEAYKDINGISDDGNLYKCGGRKKAVNGLLDGIYDEVQENDATRTWSSSYNGRGRNIPYGAIENVGDGAYLTPMDLAIGEILMPALYAIDEELAPLDYNDNVIQAGVGPFIGKSRFTRPRRIRPNKYLQTKRTQNANRKAEAKVRAVEQAIADKPVVRATRGQVPASAIPEGSLKFSTAAARRQIIANRLAKAIDAGKQRYSKFQENRATRKEAKARLKRIQENSKNNTTNTNKNNKESWVKRTAKGKTKTGKGIYGTGIGAGALIGAVGIGSTINSLVTNEKINTAGTNSNKQSNQVQNRQQFKSSQQTRQVQQNKSAQQPSRNIRDIEQDVRNAVNKQYLTNEELALIYNPIKVSNSNKSTKRKSLNTRKQNSRVKLLDAIKFIAPAVESRRSVRRNIDISKLTPEQIEILKEEITQLPRSRSKFGSTTPVEGLRPKYPNGGSSYTGYHYEYVPNKFGGVEPRLVVEEPEKIWQRSLPDGKINTGEITQLNNSPIYNTNNTSNQNSYLNNPFWNDNKWGLNIKGADWLGLGTDILGSIGVGIANQMTLKDINYDYTLPQYVDETPVAFDTTYHNGAQRANVERNRINARNIIGRNTASANTAVQRMQESDTNAMMEQNRLWDEKANKEVELRNLAAQNEQEVRARNAANRNQYYQQIAEIRNKEIDQNNAIRAQRGQALSASLAGIGQAASNFLSQAGQRYEDNQALRALAASRGAIMPSLIAAGVDMDDATMAGMIYNYNQRLQDNLVKPVRANYESDSAYSRAMSNYEDEQKLREQYRNAIELAGMRLGRSRRGRNYLNRLGLY